MALRLHREGRFRAWIGRRVGGDAATGDRLLRRGFHVAGVAVLLYYVLPPGFFVVLPTRDVLLLALGVVLGLEAARLGGRLEIPTIRPYERRRVASYAWFAIALVVAVVVFPRVVAIPVVLGTALVDPVIGELRGSPRWGRRLYPWAPVALYAALGVVALAAGGWSLVRAGIGGGLAAVVAVAVERPQLAQVDDDLVMTLLPAFLLVAVGLVGPGAPLANGGAFGG